MINKSGGFMKLLKLSILIFCLILIVIGFGFGYIYNNNINGACVERSLNYGIEKINDLNDASFTCACTSAGITDPFYFNETGIYEGRFLDSQILTIAP